MADASAAAPVTLSPRAAQQVNKVLSTETDGAVLRVAVNGGGCSGFQYAFEVVGRPDDEDLLVQRDGATVVIDPVSLGFLLGSRIDFVDDLIGQSFKIENPNATASCGCGTSFAM